MTKYENTKKCRYRKTNQSMEKLRFCKNVVELMVVMVVVLVVVVSVVVVVIVALSFRKVGIALHSHI